MPMAQVDFRDLHKILACMTTTLFDKPGATSESPMEVCGSKKKAGERRPTSPRYRTYGMYVCEQSRTDHRYAFLALMTESFEMSEISLSSKTSSFLVLNIDFCFCLNCVV